MLQHPKEKKITLQRIATPLKRIATPLKRITTPRHRRLLFTGYGKIFVVAFWIKRRALALRKIQQIQGAGSPGL
jgi:hypothetical protein